MRFAITLNTKLSAKFRELKLLTLIEKGKISINFKKISILCKEKPPRTKKKILLRRPVLVAKPTYLFEANFTVS